MIIWILASAAFAFYVANFASYNKTYGALGGVIVFLVWLWITNIASCSVPSSTRSSSASAQIEAGQPDDAGAVPRAARHAQDEARVTAAAQLNAALADRLNM